MVEALRHLETVAALLNATDLAGDDDEPEATISAEKAMKLINLAISLMLLGGIAFLMATMYMVNHHDHDIKKIAWKVVSTTISIFASVLVFKSIEEVLEDYIILQYDGAPMAVLYFVQLVLWFLIMQVTTAAFAGSIWERPHAKNKKLAEHHYNHKRESHVQLKKDLKATVTKEDVDKLLAETGEKKSKKNTSSCAALAWCMPSTSHVEEHDFEHLNLDEVLEMVHDKHKLKEEIEKDINRQLAEKKRHELQDATVTELLKMREEAKKIIPLEELEEKAEEDHELKRLIAETVLSKKLEFLEEAPEYQMHYLKRDLKCWAVMLGHINAFAAISAFGTVQQLVPPQWYIVGTIPILTFVCIMIAYEVSSLCRDHAIKVCRKRLRGVKSQAERDDAEVEDECQHQQDHLYHEEAEETENDVMGICVSMLVMQTLRLIISGELPDYEGIHSEGYKLPEYAPYVLLAVGCGWAILLMLKTVVIKENKNSIFFRQHKYFSLAQAMVLSWSILFSVDYFLMYYVGVSQEGSICTVLNALISTYVGFALIFLLDKIKDADWTGPAVDRALEAFINSLGILIGFAWERSFDTAVTGLSSAQVIPGLRACWLKLIVAAIIFVVVVPAWKWYILDTILKRGYLEEEEEEGEEGEEHEHGKERGHGKEHGHGGEHHKHESEADHEPAHEGVRQTAAGHHAAQAKPEEVGEETCV